MLILYSCCLYTQESVALPSLLPCKSSSSQGLGLFAAICCPGSSSTFVTDQTVCKKTASIVGIQYLSKNNSLTQV